MQNQFIPRNKDRQCAPLSFAQEGLWFLDQLEPNSSRYNVSRALRLRGQLAIKAVQESLDAIVIRHEVLRTNFSAANGIPTQVIRQTSPVQLAFVDLSELPTSEHEEKLQSLFDEQVQRPFDLTDDLMLRPYLIRLTPSDHVLLLVLPHITSDGWSMDILCSELLSLYEAFLSGNASPLPTLPIQYADYSIWQREWLKGEVLQEQLSYWTKALSSVPLLDLTTDYPRSALSGRNGSQSWKFSKALSEQLKALGQKRRTTFFMTLLAAFKTLLYRYTSQTDIVIAFPIANRRYVELEGLIGFFTNTLLIRTDLSDNPTFLELLAHVREGALGAYEHQDLPFEKLVQELKPERELGRNPLFQVMFQLRNYPSHPVRISNLTIEPFALNSGIAKFDLSLAMRDEADGLSAEMDFNADLFDGATITRMFGHFQTLLQSILADPGRRLSELQLLTERERRQLVDWNETRRDYPRDKCLQQLFEEQVERTPDAVAVVFGSEQLSYRELNFRANQLARYLRDRGVGPESLVGVCLNRSIEMIVCLLGVLKAGGAYVPLDPAYPMDRISFILEDTKAFSLLTEKRLIDDLRPQTFTNDAVDKENHQRKFSIDERGWKATCLDTDWREISRESRDNLQSQATAENLAYVIYTSGSTGTPKGVMIEHRNAVAFVSWAHSAFSKEDFAGVIASTSICFDLSVFELFAPLTSGGRVILVDNALALGQLNAAVAPTLINTVPSVMTEILGLKEFPPTIHTVNLAGEPLNTTLVGEIYQQTNTKHVYDLYGPSETTTYSTCALRMGDGVQTIGRPIANSQIYILDQRMNSVPVGIPGELYIGGDGVARGYINRPELTAEKFLANPFSAEEGGRLYKTGDLARYLPHGNIQFIGRVDNQVKIRGYRIELGEIEAVLTRHPQVGHAVVTVREDSPGDKRLVAYVVATEKEELQANELRQFLKTKLPDYMVPRAFVNLASLPLTATGKINRKALPAPDECALEAQEEFAAPRTPVEALLAQIWSEVLKLQRVGIHDNFFDLGGHSLLATQVISRIRDAFNLEIPLRTVFESPTVDELAVAVSHMREKGPV
jgi:amino acid adenylation domain-containing protein